LENGIQVLLEPDLRWQRRDIKTPQLLYNVLAKQKALDLGFDDVVFVDDGMITEASSSNIFVVDGGGRLLTYPTNNKILWGITRRRIIKIAKGLGIEVCEQSFSPDFVKNEACEMFLTNANYFVCPIVSCNEWRIGEGKVGKITQILMKEYAEFIYKASN
jgi:D-alanine transaminase